MSTKFRLSSLIPAGLIVERSDESEDITVLARPAAERRSCPLCNRMSDRIHAATFGQLPTCPVLAPTAIVGTTLCL